MSSNYLLYRVQLPVVLSIALLGLFFGRIGLCVNTADVAALRANIATQTQQVEDKQNELNEREQQNEGSVDEEEWGELNDMQQQLAENQASLQSIENAQPGNGTEAGLPVERTNGLADPGFRNSLNDAANAVNENRAAAGPILSRDLEAQASGQAPAGWTKNADPNGPQFQFTDSTGSGRTFGSDFPNSYNEFSNNVNNNGMQTNALNNGMEVLGARDSGGNWHQYQGSTVNGEASTAFNSSPNQNISHSFSRGTETGQGVAWNNTLGGNQNGSYASAAYDYSNGGPNVTSANNSGFSTPPSWTATSDNFSSWVNNGSGPTPVTSSATTSMTGAQAVSTPFRTEAAAISQAQINFGTQWNSQYSVAQANNGNWYVVPRVGTASPLTVNTPGSQFIDLSQFTIRE